MQTAANQLLGSIGQSLQGGSLSASGISNSASTFASDVMQAMQAYGSTTPATGSRVRTATQSPVECSSTSYSLAMSTPDVTARAEASAVATIWAA